MIPSISISPLLLISHNKEGIAFPGLSPSYRNVLLFIKHICCGVDNLRTVLGHQIAAGGIKNIFGDSLVHRGGHFGLSQVIFGVVPSSSRRYRHGMVNWFGEEHYSKRGMGSG